MRLRYVCQSVTCDLWRQHAALHQLGYLRPTGRDVIHGFDSACMALLYTGPPVYATTAPLPVPMVAAICWLQHGFT
jgi:hypothetical protein